LPQLLGRSQRVVGVDRLGKRHVGRRVSQNERDLLPGRHGEVAYGGQLLALKLDWGAEDQHVGPRDRLELAGFGPHYPRHPTAMPEPDDQFGAHRHGAALADHQTHEIGRGTPLAQRHEVDQVGLAIGGRELGFEDQRVGPIAAGDPQVRIRCWRDPPSAVVGVAQQRRETRVRVEAWPAEPIDGAVLRDERGRFTVADERVVLDATSHDRSALHPRIDRDHDFDRYWVAE
jgi:hypothetical protein